MQKTIRILPFWRKVLSRLLGFAKELDSCHTIWKTMDHVGNADLLSPLEFLLIVRKYASTDINISKWPFIVVISLKLNNVAPLQVLQSFRFGRSSHPLALLYHRLTVRVIERPIGGLLSFVEVPDIGGNIEQASCNHHCSKAPSKDAETWLFFINLCLFSKFCFVFVLYRTKPMWIGCDQCPSVDDFSAELFALQDGGFASPVFGEAPHKIRVASFRKCKRWTNRDDALWSD